MSKYFGTDGFRGEAGIALTADHAYKVGRFLGWYYNMILERNNDYEPAWSLAKIPTVAHICSNSH